MRYINQLIEGVNEKGVSPVKVFQTLFVLQYFSIKNTHQYMRFGNAQSPGLKKDVLYGFMRNPLIDWRKIVHLFLRQVLRYRDRKSVEDSQGAKQPRFFILDDSILEKTGKSIEAIGYVHSHCKHSMVLGTKLLTLGLWDGKSFFPVDFSLHNEPGKNGKRGLKQKDADKQYTKPRANDTPGFARAQEMSVDKISMGVEHIANAVKKGVRADYVLADSWFICENFLSGINSLDGKLHVIGLMRTNRKITMDGKTYTIDSVPLKKRKDIQYSRKYKCHYIAAKVEYKGLKIKGDWIRMKGNDKWRFLLCTDLTLTFAKAMQYYQIRWSIEVYFKDCKQNLGLNNCQSIDLDAYFAHISIVMMNYMLLSLRKRFEDYESIGGIFRQSKSEIFEKTIVEKIWEIILEIYLMIFAELGADLDSFMLKIIQLKPSTESLMKKSFTALFGINQRVA